MAQDSENIPPPTKANTTYSSFSTQIRQPVQRIYYLGIKKKTWASYVPRNCLTGKGFQIFYLHILV